jgi:hypothetical protein
VSGKSSQIASEAALEEWPGFAPAGSVGEAVSYQPDELTGELTGMADHFPTWHYLEGGVLARKAAARERTFVSARPADSRLHSRIVSRL